MKHAPWFIGIDLGTGSCKSVVVDEKARVLGFGVGPYSGAGIEERWQEQDPQNLLAATLGSVRAALDQAGVPPGDCAGLSIGGALHSVMALDRSGNPLTGVITWADGRAVHQSQAVRKTSMAGRLYQETGCPAHGMYPLYKIIWLREERPDVFRQASRFLSAKEYVFSRLTGDYMVDYCLAAGSGLLNTHSLQWNEPSLELAGIREDQLSPLCPPLTIHRGLHPDLAGQMGIPQDTPVVLGSSDAANSSLGAGAAFPWQATCMVGTSGALRVVSPRPVLDGRARNWCYAIDEKHWLVGGAINNGGVALSWLKEFLNQAFPDLLPEARFSFEDMLELAARAGTGAGGVICLPFFAGERSPNWNLNARAVFFGMTLKHDARHLAQALLEGIAFRFRSLNEMLIEIGFDARQIIGSGGFTQSEYWLQVMASALNRELAVPAWGETSSLGAAFWAMLAAGLGKDLEAVADWVSPGKSYRPIPDHAAIYDRLYPLYVKLYQAVEDAFDGVAEFQEEMGI